MILHSLRIIRDGRLLTTCGFCSRLWDPGLQKDCRICTSLTRKRRNHGGHPMCFDCWDIAVIAAPKAQALTPAQVDHVCMSPRLRYKIVSEFPEYLSSQMPPQGLPHPEGTP